MTLCLQCSSAPSADEQYYNLDGIGPEIIAVIEQDLGLEVDLNSAIICSSCFENVMLLLSRRETTHDTVITNQCIVCERSLFNRRTHHIGQGVERHLIAERIFPREISDNAVVCYACWVTLQQDLGRQGIQSLPVENIFNRCEWCLRSLENTRRHALPEGSERNFIIRSIHPRQIHPEGRVCYACWVAARRNVERENQSIVSPNRERMCAWCQISLHRRHFHTLRPGDERDEVAARIYPYQLPENAYVCDNCWIRAQQNVLVQQEELVLPVQPVPLTTTVTLNDFYHTSNSSARCFVPDCGNPERHCVPDVLRKKILKTQKVYVTENARVCTYHISVFDWDFLDQHQFTNVFSSDEVEKLIHLSIQDVGNNFLDFEDLESIDDNMFKYWTGVTKHNFMQIFDIVHQGIHIKTKKTALGIYLLKNRTGDSHERIASLLCTSKASITRYLQIAREALVNLFVPLHLGINHITRHELIQHNLLIPEGLFGNTDNRVPIVICDGTYIYLQKSSNYLFQKKTYSLHKYRNLVKPFLLVASDGYIVDCLGPYPAVQSDSDIMKALFSDENSPYRNYFQENDVFILDRGFRDVVPFLEELGYQVHQPESLEQGETQLSTIKANKSRFVTLCRWVVEVVNGRFKRDFKLLRQEFFNLASTHLMDDVRICAAIINAFHPLIHDREDVGIILNRALTRKEMPNILASAIIENRINRFRAPFEGIDGTTIDLNHFPEMTMSDLIIFALGTYQIKQARSYYGEHIRQHGSFRVEVLNDLEIITDVVPSQSEPFLIRGRIKSRHHGGRSYYTYILLNREIPDWDQKILSYYCSCIAGQRTVGCCAHLMTIVWYLGWARHQNNIIRAPASFLDDILVREDIED